MGAPAMDWTGCSRSPSLGVSYTGLFGLLSLPPGWMVLFVDVRVGGRRMRG
ncbi:hypothetical protein Tsubulata_003307 [Turnera subulata]|uniref:Uncharacterized protein n=1 Tax=Turnera subulata TaxID=218843 RepID=A0A9Q0FAX8_9ROSI|nr:hypothetical protein Tsubulata_003307 [Turnera subulata]